MIIITVQLLKLNFFTFSPLPGNTIHSEITRNPFTIHNNITKHPFAKKQTNNKPQGINFIFMVTSFVCYVIFMFNCLRQLYVTSSLHIHKHSHKHTHHVLTYLHIVRISYTPLNPIHRPLNPIPTPCLRLML